MPTTSTPFIDPATIPHSFLPSYSANTQLPSYGGAPRNSGGGYNMLSPTTWAGPFGPGTGPNFSGNSAQTAASILAPGLGNLIGLFLGDDKPQWHPYTDAQGNWVWTDPNQRNPVPRANVPGASLSPNKNYRQAASNTQALYDLMPYLNAAANSGIVPSAMEQLRASQLTSPGYAELMTQLYNTYGPQLNDIGNEIQRRNALAQAETTNAVLEGPGAKTVEDALGLQQTVDKPWFDTRELTANRLADLMNSIDLSGNLTENERREIAQGLAREGTQRGNLNAPSNIDTVANAMRYGNAGYARKQDSISNLSKAITNASQFLPTAKSGIDAFQTATGRTSMANSGNALFPGVNNTGGNSAGSYGLAGNLLSNMGNMDITQANIDANKKDWMDQFSQITGSLANIGSIMGKGFGA